MEIIKTILGLTVILTPPIILAIHLLGDSWQKKRKETEKILKEINKK